MIRFHAPVRSTTLSVYAYGRHRRHAKKSKNASNMTTMMIPRHDVILRLIRDLFPLSLFFSSPLLEMIGVATRDTHDGSSRISELDGFNCSSGGQHPRTSHMDRCLENYALSWLDMIKKGINRWYWNLRYWIESIFSRLWIFKNNMSKRGKNIRNWILVSIFYSYPEILGDLRNSEEVEIRKVFVRVLSIFIGIYEFKILKNLNILNIIKYLACNVYSLIYENFVVNCFIYWYSGDNKNVEI